MKASIRFVFQTAFTLVYTILDCMQQLSFLGFAAIFPVYFFQTPRKFGILHCKKILCQPTFARRSFPAMAVDKDLEDLASFLKSPSPNLKKAAVEIVQGLSGTDEGVQRLSSHASTLLPPLLSLLTESEEISIPTGEALVNLSQDIEVVDHLVRVGAVERAMELIGKPGSKLNKLLVMLLVNISNIDKGAARLLQEGDAKVSGLNIAKLVRFFSRFDGGRDDQYEYVANILVNVTRLESGRKVVLDMSRNILRQVLPQIDSRSVIRRQGVAGTVRNCCFDAETHLPSLLLASEFLWPALLLPLAGNRIYNDVDTAKMPLELATPLSQDREPETDPQVRVEACEAIYLLVLQEGGRRAFWAINGPRILELGYEDEEDSKVLEAFERVGSLLVGGSGVDADESQT